MYSEIAEGNGGAVAVDDEETGGYYLSGLLVVQSLLKSMVTIL